MRDETAIGGGDGRYPSTRLSVIERARSDDAEERRVAYEVLVKGYWKPIYKHLRLRWQRSNEDAKDLTQDFLATLIEKGFLEGYDPGSARLRTYIRVCLDRFVQNHDRASHRLKRGGGTTVLSLDFGAAEGELGAMGQIPGAESSVEETFEREWLRELFARSVDALESDCRSRGREVDFRLFERYDLDDEPDSAPTYASLAEEFEITVATVTNRLAAVRRRFRDIVLETLRQLCGSDEEFRREARNLFGGHG